MWPDFAIRQFFTVYLVFAKFLAYFGNSLDDWAHFYAYKCPNIWQIESHWGRDIKISIKSTYEIWLWYLYNRRMRWRASAAVRVSEKVAHRKKVWKYERKKEREREREGERKTEKNCDIEIERDSVCMWESYKELETKRIVWVGKKVCPDICKDERDRGRESMCAMSTCKIY